MLDDWRDNMELKPCPFCKQQLKFFGHIVVDGKVEENYRHPQTEGMRCPLNALVFIGVDWQNRPIEQDLANVIDCALDYIASISVYGMTKKASAALDKLNQSLTKVNIERTES
jgi:hypothetical protein